MFSLEQFIVYAYLFNDFFRLSLVLGVSSGMYVKLFFSAIASFVAFLASFLLLAKSRKQPESIQTFLYLSIATFAGGVSTLAVTVASYFYIANPYFLTNYPQIILNLYRIHFVSTPLIVLFFWLFFSQLIRIKKALVYLVVAISLIVTVVNLLSPITGEEVQLVLSVNMAITSSLLTLALWLGAFILIGISFYYYASKQKDERRIMGAIMGTAAVSAIMVQVSNMLALLLSNTILEASVWIFAAAAFTLMYFGLLPPKRLLPK